MAVNMKLGELADLDPNDDDMGRTWRGYTDTLTDQEVYQQNRGLWKFGPRCDRERTATFSYGGNIKVVIRVVSVETIPTRHADRTPKRAIVGRVLGAGDPDYDALIGRAVDSFRNPVTYIADPQDEPRTCMCGCGSAVTDGRAFLPGHDQRGVHDRITREWGSTLGFIRWFDMTYPPNPTVKPGAA